MSDRNFPIANDQFYHVFNRGVAKQPIFLSKKDYEQAMLTLAYYRFKNPPVRLSRFKELSNEEQDHILAGLQKDNDLLVKIVSFVLMPNHFHFLLQQVQDNGIALFVAQFSNSYTKYLNTREQRVGHLLQGVYKAVRVESGEQLIHLSRYIHLNPVVSYVIKEEVLFEYPWSSLPHFLQGNSSLVWTEPVLSYFASVEKYKQFILDQVEYGKKLEEIKHLILER